MRRHSGYLLVFLLLLAGCVTAAWLNRVPLVEYVAGSLVEGDVSLGEVQYLGLEGIATRDFTLRTTVADIRIRELQLELDVRQIFAAGPLVITNAVVLGAEIRVTAGESVETDEPFVLPNLALEQFSVSESRIVYERPEGNTNALIADCRGEYWSTQIRLDCQGRLDDQVIEIAGNYGLADQDTNPVNIAVTWKDVVLHVGGEMDHLLSLEGAQLRVELKAAGTNNLFNLLGIRDVRDGPLEVFASIADINQKFVVSANGHAGELRFEVSSEGIDFGSLPPSTFDIALQGPSLYELGAIFRFHHLEATPFSIDGRMQLDEAGLQMTGGKIAIGDAKISAELKMPVFPELDDVQLDLSGSSLPLTLLQPFAGHCVLPDGHVDWHGRVTGNPDGPEDINLSITSPLHRLTANGSLAQSEQGDVLDLNINASGFTLRELGRCLQVDLPEVAGSLETRLLYIDQNLTFDELAFDTEFFRISGRLEYGIADASHAGVLEVNVPDAAALTSQFVAAEHPLSNFPFTGSLQFAGQANRVASLSAQLKTEDSDISLEGSLGDLSSLTGLELDVSASSADLRRYLLDAERTLDELQQLSMQLNLRKEESAWLLPDIDIQLARTTANGSMRIATGESFDGSSAQLRIEGKNLENLLGPWTDKPIPAVAYSVSADGALEAGNLRLDNVEFAVGEHRFNADMLIDGPPDFSQSRGRVFLKGPSTHELLNLLDIDYEVMDATYAAEFTVHGETSVLTVDNIRIAAGESDLSGSVKLYADDLSAFDARLFSSSLYLPLFVPSLIEEKTTPETTSPRTSVFPDDPISLGWLRNYRGQVRLVADRIWTLPAHQLAANIHLVVQDGVLRTQELSWESPITAGRMDFSVQQVDAGVHAVVSADSDRLPLFWLFAGIPETSENTRFRMAVESTGGSIKSLMGNLNGEISFKGGAGEVRHRGFDRYFGDIFQSIARTITGDSERSVKIGCTAAGFRIADGIAVIDPGFVVRTDRVDVFAAGQVNLRKEQPDLTVLTKSRTGLGVSAAKILAPKVRVKGTLVDPKFEIDKSSTAINTWLALYSGGLSILASGIWNRLSESPDPCESLHRPQG